MTLVSVSDQIYVPLLLLPGLMGMLPRCQDKFWSQLAIKYHYQVKVAGNTLKSCTKHTNFYSSTTLKESTSLTRIYVKLSEL